MVIGFNAKSDEAENEELPCAKGRLSLSLSTVFLATQIVDRARLAREISFNLASRMAVLLAANH